MLVVVVLKLLGLYEVPMLGEYCGDADEYPVAFDACLCGGPG